MENPEDFNRGRLPHPNLDTLEVDMHAFKAFVLPDDPAEIEAALRNTPISPENINWFKKLTKEEIALISSDEPWSLNGENRPVRMFE